MSEIRTQSSTHRNPAHAPAAADGPTRYRTSEESGMRMEQHNTQSTTDLLRKETSVDTLETNSLCCAAAGIIEPISATTEALIPHEKLREAATPNATLIAQDRPLAQPVVGYKPLPCSQETLEQPAVIAVQIDERVEFEKEFPVPEGLQFCKERGTYIRSAGASTSDKFAREHYAYRAGFTAWKRRAWKHAQLLDAVHLQQAKGQVAFTDTITTSEQLTEAQA
ncbi:hypothetical protein [Pseudomonas cucumis]|uniref:hypothetical protein n=1 Tax=Pseudomonas cucumis TaxID=2954082 RepID=UPI0027373312|nr:hypothetical protein [Pseudomonas cucumis]WLG91549.1 hypothetical protein PSH72_05510 [Pseudomonas cucumis]